MGKHFVVLLFSLFLLPEISAQNLTLKQALSEDPNNRPNFPYAHLESVGYRLEYERKSLTGTHEYYQQYVHGFPVYGKGLKVHYRANGNIFLETNNCVIPSFKKSEAPKLPFGDYLIWSDSGFIQTQLILNQSEQLEVNERQFVNADGAIVFTQNMNRYFEEPDSLVNVHVFYPDPVTSAKSVYGGNYTDNNDQNSPALQNEIAIKSVRAHYENDTFRLENEYIKMVDIGSPTVPVAVSRDGNFFFNRSESGFEDVNVFYHLTQLREHMQTIGHETLGKTQVLVDAHGTSSDNSFYASNVKPVRIFFGVGGVDDGEDATPIIHEYGHALSDYAAPKTNIGIERSALDEGLCDYLAASYKATISDYNWGYVYPWDGHNEFWSGRISNSPKIYPEDFVSTPHSNGEIISSALMELYFEIGRAATDQLVLESFYFLDNEMTVAQYGEILLTVEQELFNGLYNPTLCTVLKNRGMIGGCAVSTQEFSANNDAFKVINSLAFSNNNGALSFSSFEAIERICIYSSTGDKIKEFNNPEAEYSLDPRTLKKGLYIFEVKTTSNTYRPKIMKLK